MYNNVKDNGHWDKLLKDRLWASSSAFTMAEFQGKMLTLKALSPKAYKYLSEVDPTLWARSHFLTYSKSNLLVINLSEYFNQYIMVARDKRIITMVETIRKKFMRRYQVKWDGMGKMDERLYSAIVRKLVRNDEELCECISKCAANGLFEFEHNRKKFVMNLRGLTGISKESFVHMSSLQSSTMGES